MIKLNGLVNNLGAITGILSREKMLTINFKSLDVNDSEI